MTRNFHRLFASLAISVFGSTVFGSIPAHALEIVATIPPIHSLVAAAAQGIAAPHLLVPGNASPHGYALRPSDVRNLEQADLVFWVGPGMEGFMEKPLQSIAGKATVVTLSESPDIEVLPGREGGTDMHLWLSPANARAILRIAGQRVTDALPAAAERVRANVDAALARLDVMERTAGQRLAPVAERPFIAFHDAFQYFEKAFGIHAAGTVTIGPDRLPGAGRVRELRAMLTGGAVSCVVHEPQFSPRLVRTLIADTPARTAALDPLGADLMPGPDLYPALIERNAEHLADCLAVDTQGQPAD